MPHNSPENVPFVTYLWVLALSLWGGIASNIRKVRNGTVRFSISELVGDVVISGFIGLLTYFICEYYEVATMLTAVFVGISGHMGTKAIFAMETFITKRLRLETEERE
ncbi:phage holin family protein [Hydrogenimonas urashimensis]|uniref:phage holin family protein n=1 Tax=Hydrogenimonas urashimensis TaxID=2740515 RepID=UPI0019150B47|nr:phage holin family protein [Hydrogenimonas urashimensis]